MTSSPPLFKFLALFLLPMLLVQVHAPSSTQHGPNIRFLKCLETSNTTSDGIVYSPGNASFASLLHAFNFRLASSTSHKTPLLIITPFLQSQIQAAIHCSRTTGLQIRIRSGGHDYEGLSYASKTHPFVVIDMRNFSSINIDTASGTAWVGAGATLGQLYLAIARKSRTLAFPAGICPTVGVGGHFSGGGYSMMSRKHSIASDHIIDAKLINANGQIHDRRSMGEDLFWAIRGGGGTSFGIIVSFKVSLAVVPETITVFNVTRTLEQNATLLVHRWQSVATNVDDRLLLRLFLSSIRSPTSRDRTIAASFTTLFLGSLDNLVPIMHEKFPELGLVKEDCTEMSWIESILYFAGLGGHPLEILLDKSNDGRRYFKGKSDYVREPIPVDGLNGIWRFLQETPDDTAGLQFSPYGGILDTYSESESPFPHRSGNLFMIHYGVWWKQPAEEQRRMNWLRRLYRYTARYVSDSPRAAYFNYRDLDIGVNDEWNENKNTSYARARVWGRKYFKNNFDRLVRVKTMVDPTNFFRNEQSVPPLVMAS
ncbi:berberine bridge enzyme-like 18 [Andrographis paniculata]|uniref:berberine bridge enzyme-like 18 n=1 Tax=Andrographis paniculata TaxID=175694 RepID=UPI0021E7EACC|nr:berberine bridge enzyme-like 18 [Andrographis paniculata]